MYSKNLQRNAAIDDLEQIREGLRPWSPLKTYGRVPFSLTEGNLPEKGFFDTSTQKWEPAGFQNYVDAKMPVPILAL